MRTNRSESIKDVGLKGLNSSRSSCFTDWMLYDERKTLITLGKVVMRKKTKRPTQMIRIIEGHTKGELLLNKG
ncbi:MAG: hypothetical protein SGJ15_00995 [Bacteroidota bacterium]|nr:hypothetical protein [Bacteroidota bacterium]